ncbi:hypothetical protein QMZ65_03225 [Pantoea sp. EABMAA-21]|uniref:hypothetical protein n=1 Tax=Pantoea sp. EABMAA-21 TaxID=3043302 RepID=UPI0024B49D21|nr:hypothetical protein [Pantoea sp. EABMAA-21]MDI9276217.1 hypothetical protein [Pantoea sp. EABMAA-21]
MSKPKAGDKVRVMKFIFGHFSHFDEFVLEEFHYCLGFFQSDAHRADSKFTPLSDLIEPAPDSARRYWSHYGEYFTDYVATYEIIKAA